MDKTQNKGYYETLKRHLGREPFPEDIKRVISNLPYRFPDSGSGEGERPADFNESINVLKRESNLTEGDVDDTFRDYAKGLKQADEERQSRKRAVRKTLRDFVVGSLIAVSVGAGAGVGLGVHQAYKNHIVNAIVHNVDKQKQELENERKELQDKFYGPLETLTQIDSPINLTSTERNLYVWALNDREVARQLFDEGNNFYNKTINGVQIIGKNLLASKNNAGSYYNLAILKKDLKSNALISVYLYQADEEKIEKVISEAKPIKTMRFDRDFVRLVDFEKKEWSQMKDTKAVYIGSGDNNGMKLYNDESWNILKEFKSLYGRGPNVNESNGNPIAEK